MALKYSSALLKLSGEALAGERGFGLDSQVLESLAEEIRSVHALGARLSLVIGGGNIIRGASASREGLDRVSADYMGMLGTVINALALQGVLEQFGMQTRVMTAIRMESVAEPYIRRRAMRHLEKGRIVIFAAGTGNPFFSTDTAGVLRALEMEAEVVLKGTSVDGVYTADPKKDAKAEFIPHLSFQEAIVKNYAVMDANAFGLCKANHLPIIVFNINRPGALARVIRGDAEGDHRPMKTIPEIAKHGRELMQKAVDATRRELSTIRSGKASTSLLDLVRVEAYGSSVPLNQVAMVAAPEPRLLTVQPFDKGLTQAIDKAIREGDLGLNPSTQGNLIRIPLPPLSEERRRDLVKVVHKLAEEGRVAVRHGRTDTLTRIKKLEHISEDDKARAEKEVQKLTDEHIRQIDELIKSKEAEIMEV